MKTPPRSCGPAGKPRSDRGAKPGGEGDVGGARQRGAVDRAARAYATAGVRPAEPLRLGGDVDPHASAGTVDRDGGVGATEGSGGEPGAGAVRGRGVDVGGSVDAGCGVDVGGIAGEAGGSAPVSRPEAPGVEIDGVKLRRLRKLMGEDLKAFAGRAGITFQYLSQLELGVRRRVSPRTFGRICDALGVDDRREMMLSEEDHGGADSGGKGD